MKLRAIDKVFIRRSAILSLIVGALMLYLTADYVLSIAFTIILFGLFQALMESRYNVKQGLLVKKSSPSSSFEDPFWDNAHAPIYDIKFANNIGNQIYQDRIDDQLRRNQ